jgi:hypothetical protein
VRIDPRVWAGVALFHLCATGIATWPAPAHLDSDLFGAPRGDKYLFLWVFWWVRHALLELHQLPFATQLQYYPTGVSLALHDMTWFWSLLAVPLQGILDPRLVLNLVLVGSLPLNGLAFFRLAREVSGSAWGALAGSALFAYCPYTIARFQLSQVSLVGVFFVPLCLLGLWRYRQSGRGADLAKAGVFAALQSLTSWYYGVALGLVAAAFLLGHALASRASWSAAWWGRLARHAALAGAAAALLVAPFAAPIALELRRGAYERETTRADYRYLEASSGDLLSYFVPSYASASWRGWDLAPGLAELRARLRASLRGNTVEKSVYPGWVAWGALGFALAAPGLRRRAGPWVALALGGFVLSLGPTLQVGGATRLDGLLPGRLLAELPILEIVRGPARFAVFLSAGAGVALALAIARVAERRGERRGIGAALACLALGALELWPAPVSLVPFDTWRSPFYERVRGEPGDFTLLDVPVDYTGALGGGDVYGYAQTLHRRPIVGGYVSREPDRVRETLRASPFLQAIEQRQYEPDKRLRLGDAGLADLRPTLARLRVRYVVLHRGVLRGSEWSRVDAWIASALGEPVYDDRWIRVYGAPAGG